MRWLEPVRDMAGEALAGLLSRPQRMLLTASGTVLGIASLVSILGLAATAGNQIVGRFDALAATEVVVEPAPPRNDRQGAENVLPWDAERRLDRLNGVVAAGTLSPVDIGDVLVHTVPVHDPLAIANHAVPVFAASPGLLPALRGGLAAGRWFDAGFGARADPVAVLGRAAAQSLGIADVSRRPAIFIGERAFTVIGILDRVQRVGELLGAIILPDGTARSRYGLDAPASVHIDTRVGAAGLVASQAPLALAPQAPDLLVAQRAPEPAMTRAKVAADVQALFLVLGAVCLLVGGLGIANTTLVSVVERTSEIGLRRALGATRGAIAGQFVTEASVTGLFGGVLGASLGVLVIVVVSFVRHWTPVLDGRLPVLAPLLAAVIGLLAGSYPAVRAARTEPIAALRTEQ